MFAHLPSITLFVLLALFQVSAMAAPHVDAMTESNVTSPTTTRARLIGPLTRTGNFIANKKLSVAGTILGALILHKAIKINQARGLPRGTVKSHEEVLKELKKQSSTPHLTWMEPTPMSDTPSALKKQPSIREQRSSGHRAFARRRNSYPTITKKEANHHPTTMRRSMSLPMALEHSVQDMPEKLWKSSPTVRSSLSLSESELDDLFAHGV